MSSSLHAMDVANHLKTGEENDTFSYFVEQFADLRILRYRVQDWDKLALQQKKLAYYLAQAALAGRDIIWDQNYKHNLLIRKTLEAIVKHSPKVVGDKDYEKFQVYVKRVWFSNGIHHHYSNDKILPDFSTEYFRKLLANTPAGSLPLAKGETVEGLTNRLLPLVFDPQLDAKKVNLDPSLDMVVHSAVNFYEGVTQAEVESYYRSLIDPQDQSPISYGLNTKLIKANGQLQPQVYKVGGLYSPALEKVVGWLKKAVKVAETDLQKRSLEKLVAFYETGDLRIFDEYNILWVQDTEALVDTINGFIEVYHDPLGHTGSWEAVVSVKDLDATEKFAALSQQAAWFEAHSPIDARHKRETVTGVSYKIINVVMEGGDATPATPIGINLPNAEWIRERHGSKSVSLGNIEDAYTEADKSRGVLEEFYLPEQQAWIRRYGHLADRLSTGLHEVIGHASGKLLPDVGAPSETLKNYASTLEEARADLVALYFIGDEHLVKMGLVPSTDIMKAEYIQYLTNGLLKQLARIETGKNLEEAHMRNRQLISRWVLEQGQKDQAVALRQHAGKTYVEIYDYEKMRVYFGQLLREVQRIKSEGDYTAGKHLVETYGVQVDPLLHDEIKKRWAALNLAPYSGFLNPVFTPFIDAHGNITDIKLDYAHDFTEQMLYYSQHYSFL